MAPPGRPSGCTPGQLLPVGLGAIIAAACLAYFVGLQAAVPAASRLARLRTELDATTTHRANCDRELAAYLTTAATTNSSARQQRLLDAIETARGMNRKVERSIRAVVDDVELCQVQRGIDAEKFDSRVKYAKANLPALEVTVAAMRAQADTLISNDGNVANVMFLALDKFARLNLALVDEVGETAPQKGQQAYVLDVLAKWTEIDKNMTARGLEGPLSGKASVNQVSYELAEGGTTVDDELSKEDRAHTTTYDPDVHGKSIALLERTSFGLWKVPGWLGRQGNGDLKQGVAAGTPPVVASLNERLRNLTTFALCAMGQNITSFMFPNAFKECPEAECPTLSMIDYVVTPMVSFCYDCKPIHHLPAFEALCGEYGPELHWGDYLYWRARSRIRLQDRLLDAADDYLSDALRSESHAVLAFVIPQQQEGKVTTEALPCGEPTLSFKFFGDDPKHPMKAKAPQDGVCAPSLDEIAGAIVKTVDAFHTAATNAEEGTKDVDPTLVEKKLYRVYVSAPHWSDDEYWALKSHPLLEAHRHVIFRYTWISERHTDVDAVDTLIAAKADYLTVGAYDFKSAAVLENHLLFHRLRRRWVQHW